MDQLNALAAALAARDAEVAELRRSLAATDTRHRVRRQEVREQVVASLTEAKKVPHGLRLLYAW